MEPTLKPKHLTPYQELIREMDILREHLIANLIPEAIYVYQIELKIAAFRRLHPYV